jgi:hypothetical protein
VFVESALFREGGSAPGKTIRERGRSQGKPPKLEAGIEKAMRYLDYPESLGPNTPLRLDDTSLTRYQPTNTGDLDAPDETYG